MAAQSKEQFYLKRKETAEDVRQSIKDWKVEQMEHHSEFVEKTAMNHMGGRHAQCDDRRASRTATGARSGREQHSDERQGDGASQGAHEALR